MRRLSIYRGHFKVLPKTLVGPGWGRCWCYDLRLRGVNKVGLYHHKAGLHRWFHNVLNYGEKANYTADCISLETQLVTNHFIGFNVAQASLYIRNHLLVPCRGIARGIKNICIILFLWFKVFIIERDPIYLDGMVWLASYVLARPRT